MFSGFDLLVWSFSRSAAFPSTLPRLNRSGFQMSVQDMRVDSQYNNYEAFPATQPHKVRGMFLDPSGRALRRRADAEKAAVS